MAIGISISADFSKLGKLIEVVGSLTDDASIPIRRSMLVLVDSIDRNFEAGGRPAPWPPSRRVLNEGGKTLIDQGQLRASISPGKPGNVFDVEAQEGEVGTRLVYAATQNFGRGGIPARPFILVQEDDEEQIQEVWEDYLFELIARGGLS